MDRVVYSGMYYIMPVSNTYRYVTQHGMRITYPLGMATLKAGFALIRFYLGSQLLPQYDEADLLSPLPVFNGLLEVI